MCKIIKILKNKEIIYRIIFTIIILLIIQIISVISIPEIRIKPHLNEIFKYIGVKFKGYFTDACHTYLVSHVSENAKKIVKVAEEWFF